MSGSLSVGKKLVEEAERFKTSKGMVIKLLRGSEELSREPASLS